ncbi:MAG: hypothetical protein D6705_08920 [Deltaproteobacteria bacterium]|nr:MAG: hypothetical protein D6705_08920 [Deltaproteobacteria bacterium]
MRTRRAGWAFVVSTWVWGGCGESPSAPAGSSDTGGMSGLVTFEAATDVGQACGADGTEVVVRARKVGCIPPPPAPCTLPQQIPEILGSARSCAAADGSLAVQVDEAGRYYVDLLRRHADGTTEEICLEDGAGQVLHDVTTHDLDAGATFALALGDGPCPPPP